MGLGLDIGILVSEIREHVGNDATVLHQLKQSQGLFHSVVLCRLRFRLRVRVKVKVRVRVRVREGDGFIFGSR